MLVLGGPFHLFGEGFDGIDEFADPVFESAIGSTSRDAPLPLAFLGIVGIAYPARETVRNQLRERSVGVREGSLEW